ncbi:putative N-acyl-L-amino acid amidohydrolase [Leptomonas seymouri]|uniref:Putative N-acyl-L-amino acid amidohydrolase n=1 Tax=Leptomonas seymouri TaxID=5684 RepID=A0A0N0P8V3_LEPSE|nr:putative N-acyl-L-amino acid amidohydrolase [Leptomonas seymouri]|eukprot:KPI90386.1 putative N-acyl-L-amino acid amidohydrolase [Leptomonas seymouri]
MHCTEIMDSVRFIFPPCREAAVWHCGGSGEGWCDGLCEEHAFDMHCMPLCESGTAGLRPALTPSYADPFKLVIRGFGRCVSTPQLLVLPVPVALAVVTVAQTIAFRKGDLKVVHVVSITTMTTGLNESHSVILDEMKLLRTVPWTGKNVRELSTCASLHVSLKYACAMA